MSSWRSKYSNKKSDNKQILKTIKRDYSSNLSVSKQRNRINPPNSNTAIQNDETWKLLKREKEEEETSSSTITFRTSIEWEEILDREFQSLDIDADGYVSIADLQSVLK
jgi:Ca2+-binding EF-hand superfamily protein